MKKIKLILGIIPITIALFCVHLCSLVFNEDKFNILGVAIWQSFLDEFED
jgi:hypothetical protein